MRGMRLIRGPVAAARGPLPANVWRLLLVTALAALVVCPAALAHGDTAERGFVSTVTELRPQTLGVFVEIRDGDDRLFLSNTSSASGRTASTRTCARRLPT
jgi:hypothetical protein